jgi:catechol 2,3-dioxygenase-like lactoylglutathione lyase family enzyme
MIHSHYARPMEIKGIIWVGSATDDRKATTRFFADVLNMPVVTDVPGFSRLSAANGDRLEFFGPDSVEHDQLDTGPVAGLWVENAREARSELIDAEVPVVTELETGPDGHNWFYFKAPDGKFYEICEHPHPRPPREH